MVQKNSISWDDLAAILAVAQARSVRAAAEKLDLAHTTLARRVEAAETALGVTAFVRSTRGLTLTDAGQAIVAHAARMAEEAEGLSRSIAGGDHAPTGKVRVTLPPALVTFALARSFARFQARYPAITLEFDTRHGYSDLDRHDADVAVRFQETPQEHLVGTQVGIMYECAYISAKIVWPATNMPLIGWSRSMAFRRRAEHFGLGERAIGVTCADVHGQLALARSAAGIAILPTLVGDSSPDVVRLPDMQPLPIQPIWVLVHPDLRRSTRVAAVSRFLTEEIRAVLSNNQGSPIDPKMDLV